MSFIFSLLDSEIVSQCIKKLLNLRKLPIRQHERIKILSYANSISVNSIVATQCNCSYKKVKRWRERAISFFKNFDATNLSNEIIEEALLDVTQDESRSGAPTTFSPEQICEIIAIALENPEDSSRPISFWSAREIAEEACKRGIVESISTSKVGDILRDIDIKPHKSRYWLNPKIDDEDEFRKTLKNICDLYFNAKSLREKNTILVSIDEKTGMQALERNAPDKPVKPGSPAKIEYEYKRHGTQCLTPTFDILTGQIISYQIGATRNEEDFVEHIKETIKTSPHSNWIFVMDQLNTHKSESLVRLFAEENKYKGELGEKGEKGILKTMESREEFLTKKDQKLQIQFTPKHCSWMNQIEIWFGIMHRKSLKRKSFKSIEELVSKVKEFIKYYNDKMAKPFKWTYEGKPLRK